jgi:hypothetical protein
MTRQLKIAGLVVAFASLLTAHALAKNTVFTQVKVIHAATGSTHIDPGLSAIISEVRSVFRYTSYRLLSSKNMQLGVNQEGQMSLPNGRRLVVSPGQMKNNRIFYQINIFKNNRSVFQTRLDLRNNSSVTIGGPRYDNGVLLINISGQAQ